VLLGEGTCKGTPGWVTLNARAGYALFDSLRLNLNVENMTDELYKYHASGAYAPGFQVSASVSGEL